MRRVFFMVVQCWLLVEIQAQIAKEIDPPYADSALTIPQLISKAKETGKTDTSSADRLLRFAIYSSLRNNDFYNAGNAWYELGEMYFNHKNYNRSLGGFINAKEYYSKAGFRKGEALTNFRLGRTQYYRGNYKLASGHLQYAMRAARQLKLKDLEANVLEYMGILYHALPAPGFQSSSLLKKSLQIKEELKDRNGQLRILQKLSDIYYDEEKFDSAFDYNNLAINLANELGLIYDVNLSKLNSVPSLLRLNKNTLAMERLRFIKVNILDNSDININIRYYIQSGNYYVAMQDTALANKNYKVALLAAQNSGFAELASLVYNNMADAYYHNKDFNKAYQYQVEYNRLLANLYSKENFTTFKELDHMFKITITEDEVKYLGIQNQIKETRLENEKRLRWILLVSTAGFLLSGAVIFYLYKKQNNKNIIIEKQAADLKVLMNEVHHRVKNNLQVISSLLDLQSLSVSDRQAAAAIRESRDRVQSMAIIHQNLYQDGIHGIQMNDYINNLSLNLFSSYNVNKEKIFLKADIDPISLDVDLVILIGLILNELISNALKYAFCDSMNGVLSITLKQKPEEIFLEVKDNGKGFPNGLNIYQTESFGYKLVKAFSQKLKARLEIFNDSGACVQLHITKFRISA